MKVLLLAVGLLCMSVSCVSQPPKTNDGKDKDSLTYFSFDHHNSMVMYNGEKYDVRLQKDGRIHVLIDEGYPDEKEFYLHDSTILTELKAIIEAYGMDKYKEDYKPSMEVHDGDSWDLYYQYNSGRTVRSGGYMAWPKNYHEAREAINAYFKKWREHQEGVLIIDYFQFTCKDNKGCDIEYSLERGKKEATLILRNKEQGVNKKLKVSNDYMREVQEMCNMANMKSTLYDYHTSNPEAKMCTYMIRYNTGDTISGYTGYTQYAGPKERAALGFFDKWLEKEIKIAE